MRVHSREEYTILFKDVICDYFERSGNYMAEWQRSGLVYWEYRVRIWAASPTILMPVLHGNPGPSVSLISNYPVPFWKAASHRRQPWNTVWAEYCNLPLCLNGLSILSGISDVKFRLAARMNTAVRWTSLGAALTGTQCYQLLKPDVSRDACHCDYYKNTTITLPYSQLFIYVQILHTSLFSQHVSAAMRHHQVKQNTIHQIISRY
jgi:hypothetical protein